MWDWRHANRVGEWSDMKLHLFKIAGGKGEGRVTHGIEG